MKKKNYLNKNKRHIERKSKQFEIYKYLTDPLDMEQDSFEQVDWCSSMEYLAGAELLAQ